MAINNYLETSVALNECENIEKLAQSAAKIAFYNFKWQFVTLVMFNVTLLCGVNTFLQLYEKNSIVATETRIPKFAKRTRQFILFGDNLQSIFNLIQCMVENKSDSLGKFLIICQSGQKVDCDEEEAVEFLWNHRIVNVIFINDISNNGGMGYYYEYGEQCKNTPAIKVTDWVSCADGHDESRSCVDKFPIKLGNLYGCPIITSTFFQPPFMYLTPGAPPSGADGDLLRILIQALNASLVIRTPRRGDGWGNLDDNGTWVGSLGDIYYNLANLSMTSATVTDARYKAFQISSFYFNSKIVWVTHPPKVESSSYKLLHPFKTDTRIALAVSFILLVVIALLVKTNFCASISRFITFGRLPDSVLFMAWKMCMGQTISMLPLKTAMLYLILFWIWYCFLIRTFYQVHLINSLTTDVYLSEFSRIEDAIDANYPFGGGPALKDYYKDTPIVYSRWRNTGSSEHYPTMINMTKGMKFVLAVNIATLKMFLMKPGRKLHRLPKLIINSPTAIFFQKSSPLTLPTNRIIKRLCEFGIPQMFFKKHTVPNFIIKPENENKAIKLKYFSGCYIILLGGWTVSFILFTIEIYINRRSRPVIRYID